MYGRKMVSVYCARSVSVEVIVLDVKVTKYSNKIHNMTRIRWKSVELPQCRRGDVEVVDEAEASGSGSTVAL